MMRKNFSNRITVALSAVLALGVSSYAAAEDGAPITMLPSTQNVQDKGVDKISIHDLKSLRDPFKRPALEGPGWHEEKPKTELEKTPVSEIMMVGVLTGPYKTRALLKVPSGAVYPVSEGVKIGVQNGSIRKVLSDRIIVTEMVQDLLGEQEMVTSEIRLNSKGVEKGVSSVRPVATLPKVASDNSGGFGGVSSAPSWSAPPQSSKPQTQASKPSGANQGFTIALPAPVAAPKVGMDNVQTSSNTGSGGSR